MTFPQRRARAARHPRVLNSLRGTRRAGAVLTASVLTVSALLVPGLVAPGAGATASAATLPTVPDSLFPPVAENPSVSVTFEDGTPVTETSVAHRGDVLLVHGTGFSPEANRGGFIMPVAPGVPNGVYVLYSGFGDQWRPSEGAPGEARTHPHDELAWVLPDSSLQALPTAPLDMRTPIARESQRMNEDGTFTARIVVDPPEQTPGDNFGVYVYPAAGSVNAAEELFVPLPFSPEPGPNTPAAPTADLVLDAGVVEEVATTAGGKLVPRDGAQVLDDGRVSYSRVEDDGADGNVVRYRGTVHATARFSLADVVVRDPWIETREDGTRLLTAEVSDSYNSSDDAVTRRVLGVLVDNNGTTDLFLGPVNLGQVGIAG